MINGGPNKNETSEKHTVPHRLGEAYSLSVISASSLIVMCVIC